MRMLLSTVFFLPLMTVFAVSLSGADAANRRQTCDVHCETRSSQSSNALLYGGAAVVGGVTALAAAPFVLTGLGFTAAGIAANSIAASMMSTAAIANGGGIATGSLVATLQSVGAAGLTGAGTAVVGAAGGAIVAGVAKAVDESD